jgi:beta-phosphoglucomutase family hydrolase
LAGRNRKEEIPLPSSLAAAVSAGMQNLHHDYAGLIFDMDGTLADTMPTHFIAWTRSMAAHGIEFSEDRFYALGGVPAVNVIEMLSEEQGIPVDAMKLAVEKEALFLELLKEVRPILPVKEIAEFHREHIPMAVATGSEKWVAEKILRALGIHDWFGAIVGADNVENPKPAPDVYLRAAALIGVDPRRCHAFEDTQLGMEAARRAGMAVVDIHTLRG